MDRTTTLLDTAQQAVHTEKLSVGVGGGGRGRLLPFPAGAARADKSGRVGLDRRGKIK